jgi:hypothetical protein
MTIEEFHQAYPIRHLPPEQCWCGAENGQAEDHICGECPAHCELEAHRQGRPSPRDVEIRRLRAAAAAQTAA